MASLREDMYPLPLPSLRRFHFDGFVVDAQSGELRRNGERIPIQEVPFRFLATLLERPGETVSREELRERIWPRDLNIDFEGSLDTAARKVRQALGDSAKAPSYIETIPGRGYRFLRDVSISSEEPCPPAGTKGVPPSAASPAPVVWLRDGNAYDPDGLRPPLPRKRLLVALGCLILVVASGGLFLWKPWQRGTKVVHPTQIPSVLALPAEVVGPSEMAYLTDAVPHALSTILAGAEGLDTKLPPTRLEVEKVKGDLGKIAELYHVENLVLSTVTVRNNGLVIDLQLAEASTRKVRWARQLEGAREDYLELVRSAANAIKEILKPGGIPLLKNHLANSEVELSLAEGRHFARRYRHLGREEDYKLALAAFGRAEALEPSMSAALAGMTLLFNDKFWNTRDPGTRNAARASAIRALDRDPRCGPAWMVLSWMETNLPVNNPEKALEYAVKAACYAPRDSRIQQGFGSVVSGSNGIFIATGRMSMELDPLDLGGYSWAALGLIWNGRAEEGLPIIERALRLEPGETFNRFLKFFALFKLGRMEEAQRVWEPRFDAPLMLAMAQGDLSNARNIAAKSLAKWRSEGRALSMDWANRAVFYAPLLVRLGLQHDALWLLQRSVDARNPPPYDWLLIDPDMQRLAGDRRFTKILSNSRDMAALCVKHMDQAKSRGELPPYLEEPLAELREGINRRLPE